MVVDGPVGVIIYLTTPVEVPVLTNVGLMVEPDPGVENPVIVPPVGAVKTEAVHANVVPVVKEEIV